MFLRLEFSWYTHGLYREQVLKLIKNNLDSLRCTAYD